MWYLGRFARGTRRRVDRMVGARSTAQPCCVRAFFLRFASLRFRFTLGFS
jgi:hypothetical protein